MAILAAVAEAAVLAIILPAMLATVTAAMVVVTAVTEGAAEPTAKAAVLGQSRAAQVHSTAQLPNCTP